MNGMRRDGQDGVDGLNGAISVVASPDDRHIYVASYDEDAVAVFGEEGQIIYLPLVIKNAGS
jgi:hypothetical protein